MREIPVHPAQASAWFFQTNSPAGPWVQLSLSLGERSSVEALRAAWQRIAAVHGMLRSGFRKTSGGELMRREMESADSPWEVLDWQGVSATEIPQRWTALLEEDAAKPLDLTSPPLIRFSAIQLPGGHCHLLMTFPQMLLDEDSLFHLLCEWLEALEGVVPVASGEEEPPAATPTAADWWKQFFSPPAEPARLRMYPTPTGASGHRSCETLLDRETSKALKRLAQKFGVETGDIVLAAWGLLAGRLSLQRRAVLLTPCRLSESLGCGYFDNLLPAELTINSGQSIEAFLKTIARERRERVQNGHIPLARVLGLAQPPLKPDQFSILFSWLPPTLNDRIHDTYPRWINCDAQLHRRAQVPFHLEARDGNRILLRFEFDTARLSPADGEKMLSRLTNLLDDFLGGPTRRLSDLRLLDDSEWDALRKIEATPPETEAPDLEAQFSAAVATNPEGIAVAGPGEAVMSYAELDVLATSLAAWLRHEKIADGWNIALCLNQTAWLPVTLWGILRAGDTCVPVDPSASRDWLAKRLDGCDVELVVCDSGTAPLFEGSSRRLLVIDQQWDAVSDVTATAAVSRTPAKALFFLTGTEKSPAPPLNALPPRLTARAVAEAITLLHLEPGSRMALTAPAGTGAFVETLLTSLASGATLQLGEDASEIETATHLRMTAGQWRVWLAARLAAGTPLPEALRVVGVDAAVLPPTLHAAWQSLNNGHVHWISALSPAGLCGHGVRYLSPDRRGAFDPLTDIPLGQAGPGLRAVLQDFEGQPLPAYFPGDIAITCDSGKKLTLPGWRDAAGCLYFLPSPEEEMARALCTFPGVLDAHVAPSAEGEPPAAWVVLAGGATTIPQGLAESLSGARPKFILAVPEFPLSAAGEIDTEALPRPQTPLPRRAESTPTPRVAREWTPLVPLGAVRNGAPLLFLVHGAGGDPAANSKLAALLGGDWTVFGTIARGLQDPAACHSSIESEAAALVEAICHHDPKGPYHLVGHGFGGLLAFEIARQMRVARRDVPFLAIVGSRPPEGDAMQSTGWLRSLKNVFRKTPKEEDDFSGAGPVEQAHEQAFRAYRARPLPGPAGLILAGDQGEDIEEAWLTCLPDAFVERMSCNWREMLTEPSVKRLAVILQDCLERPDEKNSPDT